MPRFGRGWPQAPIVQSGAPAAGTSVWLAAAAGLELQSDDVSLSTGLRVVVETVARTS